MQWRFLRLKCGGQWGGQSRKYVGVEGHITTFMSQIYVNIMLSMFTLTYLCMQRTLTLNTQFIWGQKDARLPYGGPGLPGSHRPPMGQ